METAVSVRPVRRPPQTVAVLSAVAFLVAGCSATGAGAPVTGSSTTSPRPDVSCPLATSQEVTSVTHVTIAGAAEQRRVPAPKGALRTVDCLMPASPHNESVDLLGIAYPDRRSARVGFEALKPLVGETHRPFTGAGDAAVYYRGDGADGFVWDGMLVNGTSVMIVTFGHVKRADYVRPTEQDLFRFIDTIARRL